MNVHQANYIVYHFYYYILKFCGCYTPDALLKELKDALAVFKFLPPSSEWNKRTDWINEHLLMAYLLDALKLTDHNYSLAGAGLTDRGEKLLAALRTYDARWDNCHGWESAEEEATFMKEWAG